MLNPTRLWRISAENSRGSAHGYRCARNRTSLGRAAGPSNLLPAAQNNYRYPSLSQRSGRSPVGPLAFRNFGQGPADFAALAKKPFANWVPGTECGGINILGRGNRACKENLGLARLSPWSRLRPAVTLYLSRGFSAQARVRARQLCWAATPPPARLLALASIFIAKPRPNSVDISLTPGARRLSDENEHHRVPFPVGWHRRARVLRAARTA